MRTISQGAAWTAHPRPPRGARAHHRVGRGRAAARTAQLIGAVIAGGASARFGGQPKGLHTVGGRRIVDRVVGAMRSVTSQVVLVSNATDATSWLPDIRAIPDRRPERGSLVGIHTALAHAAPGNDVLVVAWDMPFVTDELLRLIRDCATHTTFAAVPEGPAGLEPLCAVYKPAALPFVIDAIEAGDLRLSNLFARLPAYERISLAAIARIGDPMRLFFNVNSADDLAAAEQMAAARLEL